MQNDKWDLVAADIKFNLEINQSRFKEEVSLAAKILDFGCGYGRNTRQLIDLGFQRVYGVDSSQKMIDRAISENPNAEFKQVVDQNLPFTDNYFDALLVCAVFTCIESAEKRQSYIKELQRVLKPSGVLHLVEFSAEPSRRFLSNLGVPMWYGSAIEWRELLQNFAIYDDEFSSANTINGSSVQRYAIFAKKHK